VALVLLDLLLAPMGETGVGHRMPSVAIGHRFQRRRHALLASTIQQSSRRVEHAEQVVAIDALAVHAMGARPVVSSGSADARSTCVPMP
jgi:hypothetical protein